MKSKFDSYNGKVLSNYEEKTITINIALASQEICRVVEKYAGRLSNVDVTDKILKVLGLE